ncbi:carboxypeptidase-like regulatory domain-containing protein [Lutibacter citreus]|uniref:carboxypeptidase-like regulatory domain-containing protein n=1 Tax=Lutibacter citreus TaxID=2138210 RepID=UPI000DBE8893|nr:carboxypeptidase-like regulatory domain-containing protein [Lutibacter citreus]
MRLIKLQILLIALFTSSLTVFSQQEKMVLEGVIKDEFNMTIPYASITIFNKNNGTSSTEEGGFTLSVSKENLKDSLFVSSIGFESLKLKVQDFINNKDKNIVLKEHVTSLSTVEILKNVDYVKRAIKNLRQNSVGSRHQLKILYRRASEEEGISRFFVEHYINVIDYGVGVSAFNDIEIMEGRKSADYRFVKKKFPIHNIKVMATRNPLREGIPFKKYKWTKKGDTSYDGEDVVIMEGRIGKQRFLRLYIGVDTYGIYKVETSDLDAVYVYKKNKDGKLYLSYHNRVWKSAVPLPEYQRKLRGITKGDNKITVAYRHEAFVMGIETNRKKINFGKNYNEVMDMGDMKVPYHADFWKNFNVPPDTEFFRKIKSELESHYGVPLEKQYELVN